MKQKKSNEMKNKNLVALSLLVLLVLFVGGTYLYKNSKSEQSVSLAKEQAELFQRPYSMVIGDKNAKVQIVEFFDPACGTCAQFHPYVKDILKKYDGQVKVVMRYAPFHKNANYAVKMLEGAREQNKFMELLELMFSTQQFWIAYHTVNPNALWDIISKSNILDMEKLAAYMNDPKGDKIVQQDLADAETLKVTKTPTYIVNGKPLQNFGLDNLINLIESEL